jgi:hypothetical protein
MSSTQQHSVESAREAAGRDQLAEWVVDFLGSPGSDNAPLGAGLAKQYRWWLGPVELPIDRLNRLVGPSDQPVLVAVDDEEWWRDDVEDMTEQIEVGWEPPPVVVTWKDGELFLEDGNHRLEGLRRAGTEDAWAVVGFEREHDRESFRASLPQAAEQATARGPARPTG